MNRSGVALLTYRSEGRLQPRSAWGAINARNSDDAGCRQVSFRLDYSGGWGSRRKDLWRGFRNACGPYQGPALRTTSSPPARRPTARTGSSRSGGGCCPRSGCARRSRSGPSSCSSSHWSGDLPEFVVKVDWVYRRYDHLVRLAQATRARASTGSARRSTARRSTRGAATSSSTRTTRATAAAGSARTAS